MRILVTARSVIWSRRSTRRPLHFSEMSDGKAVKVSISITAVQLVIVAEKQC